MARSLKLSVRELQVARAILDDRTEFAMACELGISSHTVHTHVERLHRKLGVYDRVGVALRLTSEFLKLTLSPTSTMPPVCAVRAAGRCPLLRGYAAARRSNPRGA
jgi:DNA-binding CsgD family transcriptional regulator